MTEKGKTIKHYIILLLCSALALACGGQPEDDLEPIDVFPPPLMVTEPLAVEGSPLQFDLTLEYDKELELTIDYTLVDGDAVGGEDYVIQSGTLTFPSFQTFISLTIPTIQDSLDEVDETLTLQLSNPVGVSVGTAEYTATIIDDDVEPTISIINAQVSEGSNASVVVSLSTVSGMPVSFNYSSIDNTAIAGADYTPVSGSDVIAAGDLTQTIVFATIDDYPPESDEEFTVNVNGISGATPAVLNGTVTIVANDGGNNPFTHIQDVTFAEPNDLIFTVTFDFVNTIAMNFDYQSIDGSASQTFDFVGANQTATVLPGNLSFSFTISGLDDTIFESTESFQVSLSNFVELNAGVVLATGTINDDEVLPDLSVLDSGMTEGQSALVRVSLSHLSSLPIVFDIATTSGTALSGLDYAAVAGSATLAPLQLFIDFPIDSVDDSLDEDVESFSFDVASVVGANVIDASGSITLADNDAPPFLYIDDAAGTEGNTVVFAISLDTPSAKSVTFFLQTYDGTALSGGDYIASTSGYTINAGETTLAALVSTAEDIVSEGVEDFSVTLSGLVNVQPGDLGGVGTINDDDLPPDMSINDITVWEGDTAFLMVTLSVISGQDIGFNYTTVDGVATAVGDYQSLSQSATILAGSTFQIISILTEEDLDVEAPSEIFYLSISSAPNANIIDAVSDITIQDDDNVPYIFIDDLTQVEGTTFEFLVTLDFSPIYEGSFSYITSDGSALQPTDYVSSSGVATVAVGQMQVTIPVVSVDNLYDEANRVFSISLGALSFLNNGDLMALGTITDDDIPPSLFVQDVSLTEGSTLEFVITISESSALDVEFTLATVDIGSATTGLDFTAVASALTIPSGELALTVPVLTTQEALYEVDEVFEVTLSSFVNVQAGKSFASAGIINDDLAPLIFIGSVSVVEGETASLTLSLDVVSGVDAVFQWGTFDGTALGSGVDYISYFNVVGTIPRGTQSVQLDVETIGDALIEGELTFDVSLSSLVDVTSGDDLATVTISDDDNFPDLVIHDISIDEGETAEFLVSLSFAGVSEITFDYSTVDGVATAGGDYLSNAGTVTIQVSQMQITISVNSVDDSSEELSENFGVSLSSLSNAVMVDDYAIGSITDNDTSLFIDDMSGIESSTLVFVVSLSQIVSQDVVFSYITSDVTAITGLDYTGVSGEITIPGGSLTSLILVTGFDDSLSEATESFDVNLLSLSGALAGDIVGVGSLIDDEALPFIFIDDSSVAEGGTVPFLISLSEVSGQEVSAHYSTYDIGDALAGTDFTAAAITFTIPSGQINFTLSAASIEDMLYEPSETFHVSLTSLVNVQIGDDSSLAAITDNDVPPDIFVANAEIDEGTTGSFLVSLSAVSGLDVTFSWSTFDSTATGGVDYQTVTNDPVTLPAGSLSVSLNAVSVDDVINEGDLLFDVSLGSVIGAGLGNDIATITIDDDEGPPDAPLSLALKTPTLSPSNNTNPDITVGGLFAGYLVRLYTDSACSSPVIGSITVGAGPAEDVSVSTVLSEGLVTIYATQEDLAPSESFCSTVSLVYEVDLTPPTAATTLSLASNYAPNSTTAPLFSWVQSVSPDAAIHEVALGTTSGGEEVVVFEAPDTSTSHTFGSLALSECSGGLPVYWPSVKVIDFAGNETVATHATGFRYDTTNPGPVAGVPNAVGNAATDRASTVTWSNGADNCAVGSYEIAIGTSSGATDVLSWKDVGLVNSYQAIDGVDGVSITISNGVFYYTSVRTADEEGRLSTVKTSSGWRFVTPPDAVTDLGYAGRTNSSVDLSWSAPSDNGASITDYTIEYKSSTVATWTIFADGVSNDTSATVDGLASATSFDFRVKAYNGGISGVSNTVTQETAPDDPFFDSSLYSAMNCGGATATAFVAFDDNTEFVINGTTTLSSMNAGDVTIVSTAIGDTVTSDKPFFAAGKLVNGGGDQGKANIVWNSPNWAGKEFLMVGSRSTDHILTVYAFQDAVITITRGVITEVDGVTITGGSFDTYALSVNAGYKITATSDIVAYQYSESGGSQAADNMPVIPPSTDIIGISSRTGQYTTIATSTNYQWWESDGSTSGADSVNQGVFDSATGNGSQFSGPAARAIGDDPLIARSNADSDGYDSAPYIPRSFQRQRYAINNLSEWTSFASDKPATIQVFEPGQAQTSITLTRTGTYANEPYFGRLTGLAAGTIFESNTRFGMWYESNETSENSSSREDETVMFGYDGGGLPVNHKLKLWLDASDDETLFQQADCTSIVTSNGEPVGCWKDKSLQGNDVVQATAGSRPTWQENVTGFADKAGVNFNGTTQFLEFDENIVDGTNYTVFAIVHRDGTGSNNYFMGTQSAVANQGLHMGYSTNTAAMVGQFSNNLSTTVAGQGESSIGLFYGRLNSSGKKIYYNGLTNIDVNSSQLSSPGQGVIGRGFDTNGFDGQVAELIIFSRDLSDFEINLMKDYLKEKWLRPTMISDIRLWLDSSDSATMFTDTSCSTPVTGSGQTVNCWRDKAGFGYDAIRSTGTVQWIDDSGADIVQFTNGSLTIAGGASGAVFSNNSTLSEAEVFAYTKSSSSSETGVLFHHPAGTGFKAAVPWSGNVQWDLGSGTGSLTAAWGGNISSYYLWNFLSESSGGSQAIYRDTNLVTSDSDATTISIGTEAFTIGAASGNSNFQNVNMGTLMIFSRQLSTKERHMIRTYLDVHWK